MRGKEDYHTLKKCFKDVFIDINEIVMVGKIDVDGETVNLEFFLGGDYKLILLMLGLSGATSNYNSPDLQRTLMEMNELVNKQTKVLLRESTPSEY